jgi:hypothetical protein
VVDTAEKKIIDVVEKRRTSNGKTEAVLTIKP